MKVRALENIADVNGKSGFGDKLTGEIFELTDLRAKELIKSGYVEEVKSLEKK